LLRRHDMASTTPELARENRLLAALPSAELAGLLPQLEPVDLALKDSLYETHQPIRHVWFPARGVVSMVANLQNGAIVEVGTIGNEGMVGLPAHLGAETAAVTCFSQIPGRALRMGVEALRRATRAEDALTDALNRYAQAFFTQLSQGVACNRLHSLQERCARWLLQTHDRAMADEFPLTHEFLAQMLGVRRAGVTEAASGLQQAGAISYKQGRVTVLDRQALEDASCECYGVIRAEYERLVGPMPPWG
jgi:CRP-like cAMP-binding protein